MKMAEKLFNVFVYGTLKRGEPNHSLLANVKNGFAKFLTIGKTEEKFPLVIGTRFNIPFLLDKRGVGHHVHGEVYQVDDAMLAKLDVLEDYPQFYDREIQTIDTAAGKMDCWLYLIRKFPEKLLDKKLLETYHNSLEQAYCEGTNRRDTKIKAIEDLGY